MVFRGNDPTPLLHTITCIINSGISVEDEEISEERIRGKIIWALEVDI